MEKIENLKNSAIIIIYPNGIIKNIPVDARLLHIRYLKDLYEQDNEFKEFADKNNVIVPKDFFKMNTLFTYGIDTDLARAGVVVLHNLFILEVQKNSEYIKNAPPQFYVTLPSVLSNEQTSILKDVCNDFDMSCSLYGILMDDELDDITYDEFMHILKSKNK